MEPIEERIRIASGEGKADLLIRNGRVVNVFSGEIEKKDVAVFGGMIIGFGDYRRQGDRRCEGRFSLSGPDRWPCSHRIEHGDHP